MSDILNYIELNWFELSAAVLGIIAIFFQIKVKSFYWIVSFLNVAMYIWVYASQRLYALMILMIYYIGMSVYGWYKWRYGDNRGANAHSLQISRMNLKMWIYAVVFINALFLLITWILFRFTDSQTALLDGLVTALSFAATWMLARKKIENWLVWLLADVISCYLYFSQKMFPTLVLYIILCIMAVIGFYAWKNKMKHANE